jgi:site-specific DNA recombinase
MNQKPKAVIYTRVSDEVQTKGTSLVEQYAACKAKAEQIGAEVVGYYEDAGVSGGLLQSRLGMQNALADIENGKANILIIANVDRYSRDREHQERIRKRVALVGARLVFCDIDFEDTAEGDLQFSIIGDFAVYERKRIKDRTTKGRRRRAMEGTQPCRSFRPFGYHIVSKKDVLLGHYPAEMLGTYQVIEEEARWVREMFHRVASGGTIRGVCNWLTKSGVPTQRGGEYWRPSVILRIFDNTVYKGQAVYGRRKIITDENLLQKGYTRPFMIREAPEDEWVYIPAPALVSEEVWDTCQKVLKGN